MRDGWVEQIGAPTEVYQRPVSRFVADFLGAANFFRGRVERVVDAASLVVVPDGPTLTVPSSRAIGSQVTVALRPESIALASPAAANGDPAPNTTPAIVEQVIYHGFVTHLYLRMPNGAPLIAFRQNRAETSDAPSAPGTWLHASWPPESGHIVRDEAAEPAATLTNSLCSFSSEFRGKRRRTEHGRVEAAEQHQQRVRQRDQILARGFRCQRPVVEIRTGKVDPGGGDQRPKPTKNLAQLRIDCEIVMGGTAHRDDPHRLSLQRLDRHDVE
jgi:TOBE domain